MVKHHPKHPERKYCRIDRFKECPATTDETCVCYPPPPRPTTVEKPHVNVGAILMWAVVWLLMMVIAIGMAIWTASNHPLPVRPQDRVVVATPTPKGADIPDVVEQEPTDLSDIKPSIEIPVEAPAVEAAAPVSAAAAIEPVSHTPITKAAPAPSVRHSERHRRARHHHHRRRHHRHHHASQFCLTPRPDGLEHDLAACFTLDAARFGGLIQ